MSSMKRIFHSLLVLAALNSASCQLPQRCLYSRLDYVPCIYRNRALQRAGPNQFSIHRTRLRLSDSGNVECSVRANGQTVKNISTLATPNIKDLSSPGFLRNESYDDQLLVEYNIQCDEDRFAYPFITDLDIQGPDCTDGDGNKKCEDYILIDRGDFGSTEICGNDTSTANILLSNNFNTLQSSNLKVIFRTSESVRRRGFQMFVICAPLDNPVIACNASGESDVKIECEGITPQISVNCSFNEGPLHPCTLPLVLNADVSPPGNHSVKIVVNNVNVTVPYMINGVNEPAVPAQVPPLGVYLINESPQISNNSVTAEFQITRPVAGVRCFLRSRYDRSWKDCTSGQVSFPRLREGPHILKIHAYNRKTDVTTVKRGFVVNSDPNYCSLVLVNRGVIIGEDGTSAVIQVRVYGPSKVLSCKLDGGSTFTCASSVVLSGLTEGQHKLKISPLDCSGGSKTLTVKFDT